MTNRHALKLTSQGDRTRLEVDGHDLSHSVRSMTISAGPHVELNVLVLDVDVDLPNVKVDVPTSVRHMLVVLGWRPPEEPIITDEETDARMNENFAAALANHSPGDAGRYRCPRCGELVPLAELLDHLEGHDKHPSTPDVEETT